MKRTYVKLLLRGVKKSITRFLSIFAIVMLGVGFLAGLLATAPDMELTADTYYKECNTYDIDVRGTLGMTDDDAHALSATPGVEAVQPMHITDALVTTPGGVTLVTRIVGVDTDTFANGGGIDSVKLLSGRYPQGRDECLVLVTNSYAYSGETGDYTISAENENYADMGDVYSRMDFTAVGVAKSPLYMSIESEYSSVGNGKVSMVMYVDDSIYDLDVYTDIFVTLSAARDINSFSDEYTDILAESGDTFEAMGKTRSGIRYDEVVGEAREKLFDAQREYDDAKADADRELADAWEELTDGKTELEDAKTELTDAEDELSSAKRKLASSEKELADKVEEGWKEIADSYELIKSAGLQLESAKARLDALYAQIQLMPDGPQKDAAMQQYQAGLAQYNDNYAQYRSKCAQYDAGKQELIDSEAAGKKQLYAARQKIDDAQKEIDDGWREYYDGLSDYEEGLAEYCDAKADASRELSDAQQKIDDARDDIDDIAAPEWVVTDRTDNVSYGSYQSNVEKMASIAKVFPVFFFVVAALVALTTMTRMVEEERTQIGTLKAIGYSNGAIAFYYLAYSGAASLLGSISGAVLGFWLLPAVVNNAYAMMYTLPPLMTPFRWDYLFVIAPVAIALTMAATLWACIGELREKPARLLLPKAPKVGKRIFLERIGFIWKHMSFTAKVTARNLLRYKKRFFMTVFGVAGCCALLVTGFGLRDSVHDIVNKQFGEVYRYNLAVYVKDGETLTSDEMLLSLTGDPSRVDMHLAVHEENGYALHGKAEQSTTIFVPQETDMLKSAITLRERTGGADIPFAEDSVVMTEKMAEKLELAVGDTFTLESDGGRTAELALTGITENYVMSSVYISEAAYVRCFGETPEYKVLLVDLSDHSEEAREAVSKQLLTSDDIAYISFSADISESFANAMHSIDYIVWVLIISAGALAIIVVYNLTNINICERVRELATIKVLGFYDKEVCAYIYREIGLLAIIGTMVGLGLGVLLCGYVVRTAEVDAVMFGRDIYAMSFVFAAALTIGFATLTDLLMVKRIKRIDMVESMKAND